MPEWDRFVGGERCRGCGVELQRGSGCSCEHYHRDDLVGRYYYCCNCEAGLNDHVFRDPEDGEGPCDWCSENRDEWKSADAVKERDLRSRVSGMIADHTTIGGDDDEDSDYCEKEYYRNMDDECKMVNKMWYEKHYDFQAICKAVQKSREKAAEAALENVQMYESSSEDSRADWKDLYPQDEEEEDAFRKRVQVRRGLNRVARRKRHKERKQREERKRQEMELQRRQAEDKEKEEARKKAMKRKIMEEMMPSRNKAGERTEAGTRREGKFQRKDREDSVVTSVAEPSVDASATLSANLRRSTCASNDNAVPEGSGSDFGRAADQGRGVAREKQASSQSTHWVDRWGRPVGHLHPRPVHNKLQDRESVVRAEAEAMSVAQIRAELSKREVSTHGVLEKGELVELLVKSRLTAPGGSGGGGASCRVS